MDRFDRANALPETALTISTVLLVFLSLFRIALIGYEQSEADGASFVAAHAASLRDTSIVDQKTDGEDRAKRAFSRTNPNVTPGTALSGNAGPYDNGIATAVTNVAAQALFGDSFVSLHSQVQEAVVGTQSKPTATSADAGTRLTNCDPAYGNPATPICTDPYLARPDPNAKDPYQMYDCHAAYYGVLRGGHNGATVGEHPLPGSYFSYTPGSINDPNVRNSGLFLTPTGTLGTLLAPIANFGTPNDPCPLTPAPPPNQ